MARAETVDNSDTEKEVVSPSKKKSTNGKEASMAPEDNLSEEQVDDASDAGSADGSEYEIESIIAAKRNGEFWTYLVSWKGYTAEHNSWVDENDAGNATDLIAEYWAHNTKDKKSKKSIDKPKTAAKAGRKSAARDTSVEAPSTSASKKRGRKPKKDDSDDEADSDKERPKTAKKPRKSAGTKVSASPAVMDVDDDIGDMDKYMHHESWEKLIKTVDTVEKGPDDRLYVFFTLKADNERHRQVSEVCKKRFPQHLLDFYEGHLRWKMIDEADEA
ncbi:hypothetical protein PILCRDRAFT_814109 [Piloderma croceum F 1598]|uniref:Chromo domain-containing protein n=1 Tax=Piloderma croceum (strain F 1598) TaxID=765440 RepID=A0A0C3FUY7_PILCF|nr:hypothetical protein PILCRDRAFT_814109 [Piloderma croceum F 1598]